MSKTAKRLRREPSHHNTLDIYKFRPKNEEQADAHRLYQESDLTLLLGPAGTGKTFLATAFAIEDLLAGRIERIVITRPIIEAGESLGYLPGTFDEKVAPYMQPVMDCITKIVGRNEGRKRLVEEAIEVRPLAYMRGSTFDRSLMILDEAQNATYAQLKMFVSRIGEGSKMVINGDPEQSDLLVRDRCLDEFVRRVQRTEGVGTCWFDESCIVRHRLISRLLKVL